MKTMIVLSALVAAFVSYSAEASTCREGSEEMFLESNDSGEGSTQVWYVCKGGRFVPKFGKEKEYIRNPRNTCREGDEAIWEVQDGTEGGTRTIFVCKGGRYLPKFGPAPEYIRNPRNTCKEGKVGLFHETNSSGEGSSLVHYVCRGGRFVPLYR